MHRLLETAHIFAAALWLGGLLMGGVVAAIIFSTTPELDPRLGAFESYPGDHANLLGGYIQNRVFLAGDIVQFVGAVLALATMVAMLVWFRQPVRRVVGAIRIISLLGAISALSYSLLILSPRMGANLQTFYTHARAGEVDAAELARQAFMGDHPVATNIHALLAGLVLIVLLSGVWSITGAPQVDRPIRERAPKRTRTKETRP